MQTKSNRGWPSGKPKVWPKDVADYKASLLEQFRRENPDLKGIAREKARRAFMYQHFFKYRLPDHTTLEAGRSLIRFVNESAKEGEDSKQLLEEILKYIRNEK